MSMQSYPFVDAAFLIDPETAAYVILAYDQKGGEVPDEIRQILDDKAFATKTKEGSLPCGYSCPSDAEELLDNTCVRFTSSFTGELNTLFPERANETLGESHYDDDYIVYILAERKANLFSAAYASPHELLEEFKEAFRRNDVNLPDDYDWWRRIVSIEGTIFC